MQARTLGRAGEVSLTKDQKQQGLWNHPLFDGPPCPNCGRWRWVVLWWGGVACRRCGGAMGHEHVQPTTPTVLA